MCDRAICTSRYGGVRSQCASRTRADENAQVGVLLFYDIDFSNLMKKLLIIIIIRLRSIRATQARSIYQTKQSTLYDILKKWILSNKELRLYIIKVIIL